MESSNEVHLHSGHNKQTLHLENIYFFVKNWKRYIHVDDNALLSFHECILWTGYIRTELYSTVYHSGKQHTFAIWVTIDNIARFAWSWALGGCSVTVVWARCALGRASWKPSAICQGIDQIPTSLYMQHKTFFYKSFIWEYKLIGLMNVYILL